MADVTIKNLNSQAPTINDLFPFSTAGVNSSTYKATLAQIKTGLAISWNDVSNKPVFSTVATTGNYTDLNGPYIVNGADTGGGDGWTAAQGADSFSVTGRTDNRMRFYLYNMTNQGSCTGDLFNYTTAGGYAVHTGHQSGWWPEYAAVNVSNYIPVVLNQINWLKHTNAVGNVDFYGTNKELFYNSITDLSRYTYLGRAHFGGTNSGNEGGVVTRTFNPNNYGFRWYIINPVDISNSSIAYPGVGTRGGWAMYGCRLNKV